jgi:hypothetical protein
MSVRAMSWAFAQKLRAGEKLVLLALADRANEDGVCWPAIPSLAAKCSMSDRTVTRIIKTFLGRYLEAQFQFHPETGAQTVNAYQLFLETTTIRTPPGDKLSPAPGDSHVTPPGDTRVTPPVTTATSRVRVLREDLRNPSVEPSGEKRTPVASSTAACGVAPKRQTLSDAEFLAALQANQAYVGLNLTQELAKLDAWLLTPRGRGKRKTRGRIVTWLNRAADEQREVSSGRSTITGCVGRVQDGFRLRPCKQPIAESERGKPQPLCARCLAERAQLGSRDPPVVTASS